MSPLAINSNDPVAGGCRGTLRLGAVSYLNSKPLIWRLAKHLPSAQQSLDVPSRLADELSAGRLDVALVPIIEHLHAPQTHLVSTACIACEGPVGSVKLFFRVPPPDVRSLALDEGSRTSAALCQVLLRRIHELRPKVVPFPLGCSASRVEADAVLMIGDRAMHTPDGQFVDAWDLGEVWHRETGLPFVFAAWVARAGVPDLQRLADALDIVRDEGIASIPEIAEVEGPRVGLTPQHALHYLTHHLRFTMADRERDAINHFAAQCRSIGLLESTDK